MAVPSVIWEVSFAVQHALPSHVNFSSFINSVSVRVAYTTYSQVTYMSLSENHLKCCILSTCNGKYSSSVLRMWHAAHAYCFALPVYKHGPNDLNHFFFLRDIQKFVQRESIVLYHAKVTQRSSKDRQ